MLARDCDWEAGAVMMVMMMMVVVERKL